MEGKPRINPISSPSLDKTVPTKSTKNPYQKQTEGLKRANVSKAKYAAYNENPTAMGSEIDIQNYPEKVENKRRREGKERKGKKGDGEDLGRGGRRSKEIKSGYGRSQIAGDAAKGKLAFVGRKERGIIRAEVV